ncbi:MAG: hypothetical protein K2M95_07620 [Clostridiales bacterium]|nr:hypothetical protein [Clostridiales bacterium]
MLFCTGILNTLGDLFSGMSLITFVLVITGHILIVIELFQPSRGIVGYCGVLVLLCGIVVRMLSGGTLLMLFIMVFISVVIILSVHVLMLCLQKKAWLTHALALKLEEKASEDTLVGKNGLAETDLAPVGTVTIEGQTMTAYGNTFIEKGQAVCVLSVRGDIVTVEAVTADEDAD